jgi:secreted PhoX family phosphatase
VTHHFTRLLPIVILTLAVPALTHAQTLEGFASLAADTFAPGPEFEPDASNSADDRAQQWGMHNDGLVYFPIHGSRHGLLAQNNEYADEGLLYPDGIANWNAEKTNEALNAHGVSIVEIKRGAHGQHGRWRAAVARRRTATGTSSVTRSTHGALPARRQCVSAARLLVTIG